MPILALVVLLAASDRTVDLPFRHLEIREGVTFEEGSRDLGDAFPYLSARVPKAARPVDVTPATLRGLLAKPITKPDAAYEAVRLFVAGVPVEEGQRLLDEAKKLKAELKRHTVKAPDEVPERWARDIRKTDDGWKVEFVAFEMDRVLTLVRVSATVLRDGTLEIERTPIIEGPATIWQTATLTEDGEVDAEAVDAAERAEEERRAEAALARRRFAAALGASLDLDTAFAVARLRLTPQQIGDLWPQERRVIGSGRRIVAVDLEDGTSAVYDATEKDEAIGYLLHSRGADGPGKSGAILHRLAAMR